VQRYHLCSKQSIVVTLGFVYRPIIYINQIKTYIMGFFRVLLSILFPPLAVIDKGCGSILIVFLLTLCGWIPGVIAALVILNNPNR
jgi:uncharacterized membrane protein YqaE (UPF0057 family)